MLDLDHIRPALGRYRARTLSPEDRPYASVAMILGGRDDDLAALFIERAERPGDPWSGQMAFPGGRVEEDDRDARSTAERETAEEVGLALSGAESLGRLDDQEGRGMRRRGLVVSAFVFHLPRAAGVAPNHEVREALWVPLSHLVDPERRVEYRYPPAPMRTFPGIQVGEPDRHVVWGLTHRFLDRFFEILGRPLP